MKLWSARPVPSGLASGGPSGALPLVRAHSPTQRHLGGEALLTCDSVEGKAFTSIGVGVIGGVSQTL